MMMMTTAAESTHHLGTLITVSHDRPPYLFHKLTTLSEQQVFFPIFWLKFSHFCGYLCPSLCRKVSLVQTISLYLRISYHEFPELYSNKRLNVEMIELFFTAAWNDAAVIKRRMTLNVAQFEDEPVSRNAL